MDVVQIFACRQERSPVACLFDIHMVEITHQTDAEMLYVAADCRSIRQLPQEEGLATIERLKQNPRAAFYCVLAEVRQHID